MAEREPINAPDFIRSYCETVDRFLHVAPSLPKGKAERDEMAVIANRLQRMYRSLANTPIKGNPALDAYLPLLGESLDRLDGLVALLDGVELSNMKTFDRLDEIKLYNEISVKPPEDVADLLRLFNRDPLSLDLGGLFQALEVGGFAHAIPIELLLLLIKLITIIIAVLLKIFLPDWLPDAVILALIHAWFGMDGVDLGEGFGGQNADEDDDNDGALPVPGGGTVSPGDDNTVIVRPDGTIIVITPGGGTVVVGPDGSITPPPPPPPPPLPYRPDGHSYIPPSGAAPTCGDGKEFQIRGFGHGPTAATSKDAALAYADSGARNVCPSRCPAVRLRDIMTRQDRLPDGTYWTEVAAHYTCPN